MGGPDLRVAPPDGETLGVLHSQPGGQGEHHLLGEQLRPLVQLLRVLYEVLIIVQPWEAGFFPPEEDLPVVPVAGVLAPDHQGAVVDGVHGPLRP